MSLRYIEQILAELSASVEDKRRIRKLLFDLQNDPILRQQFLEEPMEHLLLGTQTDDTLRIVSKEVSPFDATIDFTKAIAKMYFYL